jgi:hypothetical protein
MGTAVYVTITWMHCHVLDWRLSELETYALHKCDELHIGIVININFKDFCKVTSVENTVSALNIDKPHKDGPMKSESEI